MPYIRPQDVQPPQARGRVFDVLREGGAGECAYALGEWDGARRLLFRWNGTDERPLGDPIGMGVASWTALDPELQGAVLPLLAPEKQVLAIGYLELGVVFDVCIGEAERTVLIDPRKTPWTVARVPHASLRAALDKPELSAEQCRLVLDRSRALLAAFAGIMLVHGRGSLSADGRLCFVDIDDQLRLIAGEFNTSVLQIADPALWAPAEN